MVILRGRLQYLGWFNKSWRVITEDGEVDLWPTVEQFFFSLNGKKVSHKRDLDGYTISVDESSEYEFEYKPGRIVWMIKPKGFGGSNVHAYLDEALVWLSGRLVVIKITTKELKVTADKSEKVNGVYFAGEGNSCEVPNGIEKAVCKIGQPDCCIFLSAGAGGFYCEKFSGPTARVLLDRLAKGTIRASRIGNCALLGRKDMPNVNTKSLNG